MRTWVAVVLSAVLVAGALSPISARDGLPPVTIAAPSDARAALVRHAVAMAQLQAPALRARVVVVPSPCPAGTLLIVVLDQSCSETTGPTGAPELRLRGPSARDPRGTQFSLDLTRQGPSGNAVLAFGSSVVASVPADGRLAVVGDRTMLARTLRKSAVDAATGAQRRIVFNTDFQAGARDYRTLAAALVATDPTDVAIAAFPAEAAILVRDLRALNPALRIHGSYLLANPSFARQAGPAAEQVTVALTAFADVASAGPDRGALVARLFAPLADMPTDQHPQARWDLLHVYVALLLADQALTSAGPTASADAIRQALGTIRMDTLLAPVVFDTKQATFTFSTVRARWRNGELVRDDAAPRSADNPK